MKTDAWKEHLTPRERNNRYEHLLSGGAKIKLLESFVDLDLGVVLWEGPLSAAELTQKLVLQPHRARKWLHLLHLLGLLEKKSGGRDGCPADETYSLTLFARSLFSDGGKLPLYYANKVSYWKKAAEHNLNEALSGASPLQIVRWPPQTVKQVSAYMDWMNLSADVVLATLRKAVDFRQYKSLLHVGGADGLTAYRIAQLNPGLSVTVFHQPTFAYWIRKRIENENPLENFSVVEGDAEGDDELPEGYSVVLWTRVFSDLPDEFVSNLLKKTRRAVNADGRVILCETTTDGNEDFVLTCEFNYLFADDLGARLFKTKKRYESLLKEANFRILEFREPGDQGMYSVITAEPV